MKAALGTAGNEIEKHLEVFNETNNVKLLADCSKSAQRAAAGLELINKRQIVVVIKTLNLHFPDFSLKPIGPAARTLCRPVFNPPSDAPLNPNRSVEPHQTMNLDEFDVKHTCLD